MKNKFRALFLVAGLILSFAVWRTVRSQVEGNAQPQRYIARLTQSGTGAPTATVRENTIGTIVWSRQSPGVYFGSLEGAFPLDRTDCVGTRTWFDGGPSDGHTAFLFVSTSQSPDRVVLVTQAVDLVAQNSHESDDMLTNANELAVEITVYPAP